MIEIWYPTLESKTYLQKGYPKLYRNEDLDEEVGFMIMWNLESVELCRKESKTVKTRQKTLAWKLSYFGKRGQLKRLRKLERPYLKEFFPQFCKDYEVKELLQI